jgi:hypothetical protein
MKALKLPETDSIEELARFWDSHDLTDFEDQLKEDPEPVFERKRERVMVLRLGVEEVQAVEEIARSRGLGQTELLREWVREKLGALLLSHFRVRGLLRPGEDRQLHFPPPRVATLGRHSPGRYRPATPR